MTAKQSIQVDLLPTGSFDLGEKITDEDYTRVCEFVLRSIGIRIGRNKKSMVASRLAKRVRFHGLESFSEYFRGVMEGGLDGEQQVLLDLLTTNETYLFREPAHFHFLRDRILQPWDRRVQFRAWSAACSTGEEAYSVAMTVHHVLGTGAWEVVGSDVSRRVLDIARRGKYPMARTEHTPHAYLKEYCRRGVNAEFGSLLVCKHLRNRVRLEHVNLVKTLPRQIGMFDTVFLRNTLIYFDEETRKEIIERVVRRLKRGGYFFVSHTESIAGLTTALEQIQPSIYRKTR